MKKLISVLLVVCMLAVSIFTFAGCGGEKTDWDYIKDKGVLVVGYDNSFPPMGFVDSVTKKDVGFDLDLANAVGEALGVKVKLQPIVWSTKETELASKNIDLIWNGYTITDKRKAQVNFSTPYLKNEQVIVVKKTDKEKYSTIDKMAGAKLTAQEGSTALDAIAANEVLVKNTLVQLADNVQILNELKLGYTDIAVMDYVVVNYLLSQDNDFAKQLVVVEGIALENEEYGVGIRKGDEETTKKINEALASLKKSGKLQEVAKKWGLENLLLV
ncbi:MAG: transporter substrate-binding domain-containing protein [Clostridia bacterium]